MQELIDDLVAEQEYLDAALAPVPVDQWENPSPAEGWLLRDCVAHLAEVDEMGAAIATLGRAPEAEPLPRQDPLSGRQALARSMAIEELVSWWREARQRQTAAFRKLDPKARLPWAGPPMSARSFATARLMECWSHGLDALDAAGIEPVDSDRLRSVAHLGYITREFAYRNNGLEPPTEALRVELIAPSGAEWAWGPEDAATVILGTAGDFCRVVTQRIHHLDTALETVGESARDFLGIAQAFAGPPGPGRPPKDAHN